MSACIEIHRIAKTTSLTDLADKAWQVMLKEFTEISQLDSFKEMSETEVQEYIRDEGLGIVNQNPVFEAVVTWVRHDEKSRKATFDYLMDNINLSLCSPSFLGNVVRMEPLIKTVNGLQKLSDAQHHFLSTNAMQQSTASRGCGEENALVAVCKDNCWILKSGEVEWVNVRSSVGKRLDFSRACMTVDGILLTGGYTPNGQASKICWKFSFDTLDWVAVSHLNVARYSHTTVSVGNRVYVIAGYDSNGKHLYDVEFLDETTAKWHDSRKIVRGLYCHVGVAYEHFAYVFGGHGTAGKSKETLILDTKCHRWSRKADISIFCHRGSSVVYKDRIYVLGGAENCCLSYDPDQDQWKTHCRPAVNHDRASAVVWKDRILLCGGTDTSVIEEYNPVTDTWSMWRFPLPEKALYPAVFAVHL